MPALSEVLAEAGHGDGPVLGCSPLYPPLELFHAMGLSPVVLWGLRDVVPAPVLADRHLQTFVCSVARRLMEAVLGDPGALCGLFMYNACDTLRNLPELLERGAAARGRAVLPVLRLHVPAGSAAKAAAADHLRAGIERLVGELSAVFGVSFSPDRFAASVELHRELRRLALEGERLVASGSASFRALQELALAGALAPVQRQLEALRSFLAAPSPPGGGRGRSPGVILSGILPPPAAVTDLIEGAGLTVVANDIALMHRSWAHTPGGSHDDPATYYAAMELERFPCTTRLPAADRRMEAVEALVRRSEARGWIFVGEKFCEYEYLEAPHLADRLRELGIRTLELEIAPEGAPLEQLRTRIETFAEILERD